jgi:hypothetical protein
MQISWRKTLGNMSETIPQSRSVPNFQEASLRMRAAAQSEARRARAKSLAAL